MPRGWSQVLLSPPPTPPTPRDLSQEGCLPLTLFSPTPAPPVILGDTEELVEEVTVNASSTVSLRCPAMGNPAPTISWFQNGLPVSPSPQLQVLEDEQVLQVRPSRDAGKGQRLRDSAACLGTKELPLSAPHEALCLEACGSPWDFMQPTIVCLAGRHRASQKHPEVLVMPEKDPPACCTDRPGGILWEWPLTQSRAQHVGPWAAPSATKSPDTAGPLEPTQRRAALLRAGGDYCHHLVCCRESLSINPTHTCHR